MKKINAHIMKRFEEAIWGGGEGGERMRGDKE